MVCLFDASFCNKLSDQKEDIQVIFCEPPHCRQKLDLAKSWKIYKAPRNTVDDFFLDGKHSNLRVVLKILKNAGKNVCQELHAIGTIWVSGKEK